MSARMNPHLRPIMERRVVREVLLDLLARERKLVRCRDPSPFGDMHPVSPAVEVSLVGLEKLLAQPELELQVDPLPA